MEKSDQPQRELILTTPSYLQQNVLEWLLNGELQNPVVSSFADLYLLRLVAASKKKVELNKHGTIVLPRWQAQEEDNADFTTLSYGYHPAEVAFALTLLNDLLSTVSHNQDTKKLTLSKEMLLGFSAVLGYYNLMRYLLQLPQRETLDEKPPDEAQNRRFSSYPSSDEWVKHATRQDILWFDRLCDLSQPFAELESTSSQRAAPNWLPGEMPPLFYTTTTNTEAISPDIPCWIIGGRAFRGDSAATRIVTAEKRRLLAFIKSLRMLVSVLAPFAMLSETQQQRTKAVVQVKAVTHQAGAHTYHLELTDTTFLTKSYPFLLRISPDDEVLLREEAEDNG